MNCYFRNIWLHSSNADLRRNRHRSVWNDCKDLGGKYWPTSCEKDRQAVTRSTFSIMTSLVFSFCGCLWVHTDTGTSPDVATTSTYRKEDSGGFKKIHPKPDTAAAMTVKLSKNKIHLKNIHWMFNVIAILYHFSSHSCNSSIIKWNILPECFFQDLASCLQQRGKLPANELTSAAIK